MVLAIISKTAINKNTRLYIIGCKIGCLFCKTLIFNVYCGAYGTGMQGFRMHMHRENHEHQREPDACQRP